MTNADIVYSYLLFHVALPYRLFLDPGVYYVGVKGVRWRLSLKDMPQSRIPFTQPPIDFGVRAQLELDNHGIAGHTEISIGYPLDPPIPLEAIFERQTTQNRVTLRDALAPLNRLIALYRAKTREYWFRPIGDKDIPALTLFVLPEGKRELEFLLTRTNAHIASGYPFLKTEDWYEDLTSRAESGEMVPFFMELLAEGEDALARDNLRLAATNFALCVEALLRTILTIHFPDENVTRSAGQMIGRYFGRFREIGDPKSLPFSKKRALELFKEIWQPRDLLMHGHDVDLTRPEVEAARAATMEFSRLWGTRPGARPLLIDGPFVDFAATGFPSRDPHDMIARAKVRYQGNHLADATEAASYALMLDSANLDARMMVGVCAASRKDYHTAIEHFQYVVERDPTFPGVAEDLAAAQRLATTGADSGAT